MVYKLKDEIDSYIFSIRGNKSCKVHLGRVVNQISSEVGGSGGGHEKACGGHGSKRKTQSIHISFGSTCCTVIKTLAHDYLGLDCQCS